MHKVLMVICDGMPDRPLKELGNKTPLEVAKTPNLDRLAVDGISGMMHSIEVGVRPGSDTAHLSIFGYDPYKYYSGRGPYECAGIEADVRPGDVAFRANAGTIDDQGMVTDRRAGRIASTKDLVAFLGDIEIDGVQFLLKSSLGHRIGLVMRGENLSPAVTDQDPHKTGIAPLLVEPTEDSAAARRTADLLNKFSKVAIERLAKFPYNQEQLAKGGLPANMILFRGAGAIPKELLSFKDKYGLHAAFVAGAPMYKGIAKILGMDVIDPEATSGVTGLPDSNLPAKVATALAALETHDIVFMHIKAADSLAEDGNYQGKTVFIEKIDAALAPLIDRHDLLIVITSDHTTSSQLKMHTADPVPVVFRGDGVRTDDVVAFTERECAKGRLGTLRGANIMPIIIDLMGLSELYGA